MARVFENPINGYRETVTVAAGLGALFFGPLYFIVKGVWTLAVAEILLVLASVAEVSFLPFVLIIYLLFSMTAGEFVARNYKRRGWIEIIDNKSVSNNAPPEENKEWKLLLEYDPDIKDAAKRISALGAEAMLELQNAYLAIKDPTKLPFIVKQIETKFTPPTGWGGKI